MQKAAVVDRLRRLWDGAPKVRRFSLRIMLLAFTVLAVGLGWIANRAYQQRPLIDLVREKRGYVLYDCRFDLQKKAVPEGEARPMGPPWLREMLGPEFCAEIVCVAARDFNDNDISLLLSAPRLRTLNLWNPRLSDSRLLSLRDLQHLSSLWISNCEIQRETLETVGLMRDLRSLKLQSCRIDGAAIKHLRTCRQLEELELDGSKLAAASMELPVLPHLESLNLGLFPLKAAQIAALAEQPALRALSLSSPSIGDAELAGLVELDSLERVHITGGNISDAGVQHLSRLASIRWLDLHGSCVTDDGVAYLTSLSNLRSLDLSYTRITDRSVPLLGSIPSLERVRLNGTALTQQGLADLRWKYGIKVVIWNPPLSAGTGSTKSKQRVTELTRGYPMPWQRRDFPCLELRSTLLVPRVS